MTTSRRNLRRVALLALVALPPTVAVSAPGCAGAPGEYCDLLCECEKCSDLKEEDCLISRSAEEDTADAYGCDGDYEDWIQCAIEDNNCDEQTNQWTQDESCSDERQNWLQCVADASDHTTTSQGQQVSAQQQVAQSAVMQSSVASTTASMSSSTGMGGFGGAGGAGGAGGN